MATKESLIAQGLWDHYNDRPAVKSEGREAVSVPREPTMGQWDDFCSVHHIPFDKFMAAYKAMLAAPPAPNRDAWIPVSERLPEKMKEVYLATEKGWIGIASLDEIGDWINPEGFVWGDVAAYWQPLPAAPAALAAAPEREGEA